MSFVIYDIVFLTVFILLLVWFFYKNRKYVEREAGIMFLYKTQVGVRLIEKFSKKFKNVLLKMQYPIVISGYLLMAVIVYVMGNSILIYLFHSKEVVQSVSAPPVAPLIPYFPKLFGLESFFPPLYFIYFLVALVVVLFVHEFSHGIFMKLYNIKIKSTGLAAFGPLLGAFVEQDEKDMRRKGNFQQRVVLAAGTFANLMTGLIFLLLFIGFFYLCFMPSGYVFTNYAMASVPVAAVSSIGNLNDNLTEIFVGNQTFLLDSELKKQLDENLSDYLVLADAPAVRAGLEGAIISINGKKIIDQKSLVEVLNEFKPGDEVEIKTETEDGIKTFDLVLGNHPAESGRAYLGVANILAGNSNFVSLLSPEDPTTYYKTKWDGEFVFFIYYFLFWIMFINIMVALFNMLPVGFLDGGRFFELTILAITKSEKTANRLYKIFTYGILIGLFLMMVFWYFARF